MSGTVEKLATLGVETNGLGGKVVSKNGMQKRRDLWEEFFFQSMRVNAGGHEFQPRYMVAVEKHI